MKTSKNQLTSETISKDPYNRRCRKYKCKRILYWEFKSDDVLGKLKMMIVIMLFRVFVTVPS